VFVVASESLAQDVSVAVKIDEHVDVLKEDYCLLRKDFMLVVADSSLVCKGRFDPVFDKRVVDATSVLH
jgi:hypothetical protein